MEYDLHSIVSDSAAATSTSTSTSTLAPSAAAASVQSSFCLSNLPRTVGLSRDAEGNAQFAYIDQRKLPDELDFVRTGDWQQVVDAVKTLAVRGALAIGVAGVAALALWAACETKSSDAPSRLSADAHTDTTNSFLMDLEAVTQEIAAARPTAVNLAWGVDRAHKRAQELAAQGETSLQIAQSLFDFTRQMEREDEAANRAIGAYGAALLPNNARILTHCNAGSLGTVFFGTALGVVYTAAEQGKIERVYADETRPVGQGARLTTWELSRAGVPTTLICDNMAASLMAQGKVDAVLVGADRVAANGDVANKIGTYGVAVLAHYHNVPFYVAAPTSSLDPSTDTGALIPIEERDPTEVLPHPLEGVDVWNPAFDVTPAALIKGIITEHGVFCPHEVMHALEDR